jgi:protocatechuate 3,4-dioxygenase beta subunit
MRTTELLDVNPPYLFPDYAASVKRAPHKQLVVLPDEWFHRLPGPAFGRIPIGPNDNDLLHQHEGRPLGQRILLNGRLLDSDGRGVPKTLVEIWQANASGAYVDQADPAFMPLDPNFTGAGRCLTDDEGRYRFITVKPGAYPWGNHENAWRAAHIHVSVFGPAFATRLVTQMYFPGDPLFYQDPIFNSVRDPRHRDRMISAFDLSSTVPEWALAYEFDIVLRGRESTPMED